MAHLAITPLPSLRVSSHLVPAHGLFPNTSLQNKPLLIYHACFPDSASASIIESHLKSIRVVTPQWRYTMYSTSHFHSNTHEILCISSGYARLCFGGEENPERFEPFVQKGDVIIIPAGVAHCALDVFSSGFEMVGSYPKGKAWDMCYGVKGEETKVQGMKSLGWFNEDPLYGSEGPVLQAWRMKIRSQGENCG